MAFQACSFCSLFHSFVLKNCLQKGLIYKISQGGQNWISKYLGGQHYFRGWGNNTLGGITTTIRLFIGIYFKFPYGAVKIEDWGKMPLPLVNQILILYFILLACIHCEMIRVMFVEKSRLWRDHRGAEVVSLNCIFILLPCTSLEFEQCLKENC